MDVCSSVPTPIFRVYSNNKSDNEGTESGTFLTERVTYSLCMFPGGIAWFHYELAHHTSRWPSITDRVSLFLLLIREAGSDPLHSDVTFIIFHHAEMNCE